MEGSPPDTKPDAPLTSTPEDSQYFHALVEDYKLRSHDVRMRSAQYERLWMLLVSVLGAVFAWSIDVNVDLGVALFSPTPLIVVVPILILIWGVFLTHVLCCNKLSSFYLLSLERQLRQILRASKSSDDVIAMRWREILKNITQDPQSKKPTSIFGWMFSILVSLVIVVFVGALLQSVILLNGKSGWAGYVVGLILFFIFVLEGIMFFRAHGWVIEQAQSRGVLPPPEHQSK
ncbi:MAG TPA: hypothetical protein VM118_11725 [Acidobacteriota bacterium]|nr:hypothetical protein [Acidobacteriota bacterium]